MDALRGRILREAQCQDGKPNQTTKTNWDNFKALTSTTGENTRRCPTLYLYEFATKRPLPLLLLSGASCINKDTHLWRMPDGQEKPQTWHLEGTQELTCRQEKPVSSGLRERNAEELSAFRSARTHSVKRSFPQRKQGHNREDITKRQTHAWACSVPGHNHMFKRGDGWHNHFWTRI